MHRASADHPEREYNSIPATSTERHSSELDVGYGDPAWIEQNPCLHKETVYPFTGTFVERAALHATGQIALEPQELTTSNDIESLIATDGFDPHLRCLHTADADIFLQPNISEVAAGQSNESANSISYSQAGLQSGGWYGSGLLDVENTAPGNLPGSTSAPPDDAAVHLNDNSSSDSQAQFACTEPGCDRTYHLASSLSRHRATHTSRRFPCKYCRKYQGEDAFKRKDHLRQHIQRCHGVEKEEFEKYCSYKGCRHTKAEGWAGFRNSKEFSQHMRLEHGDGVYECGFPGCNRTGKMGFKRESDLQKHRSKAHATSMPGVLPSSQPSSSWA
ncbi:hypothetical protein NA57DRAFT_57338 [Rhizodiscina lignyota]|uniref:C2H2-type domain-containing protein n=1 Tax=Rhizodiscina lignyota TaxID=1504668 RepID=A0A9P4M8B0_9PEZI|nr:hypothetical protein NA57DRAFT_57338 [Rhizodiscina lignyota]